MTRTRYKFLPEDTVPYFLTSTTVGWLPLFSDPHIADILVDALKFLISHQRMTLYAYVIMKNHIHLIASAENLSKEMANFKSFTARRCIAFYLDRHMQDLLEQLRSLKLQHKTDRPHQFWQEGSHPQRIKDEVMMSQKVEYIHQNPVQRGYVDEPEDWQYSSARDYGGSAGLIPVVIME